MLSCRNEILSLTDQLVRIQSIVNSKGEKEIATFLHQYISTLPYFTEKPDHILLASIPHDELERMNVIACVKGAKSSSNKAIILMGHFDTVGIDDYNHLQDLACHPKELMEALQHESLPPSVQEHLESGDWLFGRGVLDMKSGVASNLFLLKYYSEHPEELDGNLVFVATCDEEDSSIGIRSAVKTLNDWKDTHGFDYIAAINSDFVSPRYEGDEQRYIYKGTVGKLLPAFYIVGAETHVGSAYEGLDPNLISAELIRHISYNPELCNEAAGEITGPPVSLKQMDLKSAYTVQTAVSAYTYFNFFTYSWSPKKVLELLKEKAIIAFDQTLSLLQKKYIEYSKKSGQPELELPWKTRVFTFEEMDRLLVQQHGEKYTDHINTFKTQLLEDSSLDIRMYALKIVEEAWKWMKDQSPTIVLFYASLHFPRIELTGKNVKEQKLITALDEALEVIRSTYKHPIVAKDFFPYISDMSFVSISDNDEDLMAESSNNPAVGTKIKLDYSEIRKLNVPVINIGPYGIDAHKKYERLEMTYSFEIVPNLTKTVIQRLFSSDH